MYSYGYNPRNGAKHSRAYTDFGPYPPYSSLSTSLPITNIKPNPNHNNRVPPEALATFQGDQQLRFRRLLERASHWFRFCYEIGSGGFGTVWAAERIQDGYPVAIKMVRSSKVAEWAEVAHNAGSGKSYNLPIEIALHSKVSSVDGVIDLIGYFLDISGDHLLITARPKNSIDLFDFISKHGPLDEEVSRCFFSQVVETTVNCHRRGVVHRDLKDENLLVDLETGKLAMIDFGSSAVWQPKPYENFSTGTKVYCPPEWVLSKTYDAEKGTVWTLGVLLFDMLYSDLPFKSSKSILASMVESKCERIVPLSNMAHDLLWSCLHPDATKRPTIDQVRAHPWLRQAKFDANFSINFQKYVNRTWSKTHTSMVEQGVHFHINNNMQCVAQQQQEAYATNMHRQQMPRVAAPYANGGADKKYIAGERRNEPGDAYTGYGVTDQRGANKRGQGSVMGGYSNVVNKSAAAWQLNVLPEGATIPAFQHVQFVTQMRTGMMLNGCAMAQNGVGGVNITDGGGSTGSNCLSSLSSVGSNNSSQMSSNTGNWYRQQELGMYGRM